VLISSEQVPSLFIFTDAGPYTVQLKVGNDATFDIASTVYTVESSYLSSPVMQKSTSHGYPTLQGAYDKIAGLIETIKMKESVSIDDEEIVFDRLVTVILEGGYDDLFKNVTDFTRIHGNVIISDGTVFVSNVIISSL